jgi:hypothetical protein
MGLDLAGARVDPGTVKAWMGHVSIATTNGHLHDLGSGADIAELGRLNEDDTPRGRGPTDLRDLREFEPLTFSLSMRRIQASGDLGGYR